MAIDKANDNLVNMGSIVAAFGIMGLIKIKTDNSSVAASLAKQKNIFLYLKNSWVSYKISKASTNDNIVNLKLVGIDDRDAAIALKGTTVAIPRENFPKLKDPDEFYWVDLIGLEVINKESLSLGTISNLMESGSGSVLVIDGAEKQHLIPFVNAYIIDVDLNARQIIVDWGIDY